MLRDLISRNFRGGVFLIASGPIAPLPGGHHGRSDRRKTGPGRRARRQQHGRLRRRPNERLGIPEAVRERNIETRELNARGIAVIRVAAAFEAAQPGNLQPDGIHFAAAGHDLIARLLIDHGAAALEP